METDWNNLLVSSDDRHIAPIHTHEEGQLTLIERGILSLEIGGDVFAVPAGRLHWIPAGVVHASRSHGEVRFHRTLVSPAMAGRLPDRVVVVEASPLLVAALARLRDLRPASPIAVPLADIVVHEIHATADDTPTVRLPANPRLRHWALTFLDAPDIRIGIDAAATTSAMSRRSFTRHFQEEVGLSFSVWKRTVVVHQAEARLAEGAGVSELAFAFGYETVSAFIAMFKAMRGRPPGAYRSILADP